MSDVSRALHSSGQEPSNSRAGVPAQRRGTFAALRFRNFKLFWWGQVISVTGTFMQSTAQQWLVLTLAPRNPLALGVTGALQFGPSLLLGPFAGGIIDRYPRRNILYVTQIAQSILAAVLWLLTLSGLVQIWHVYFLALLLGLFTAIDNPTRQAFVSEMVPTSHLLNAISLNSVQFNVARIVGPAIAGGLIALLGIPTMFLLNAISFIAVLIGLRMMRASELYLTPRRADATHGLRAMSEGVRFIWANYDVRVTFLLIAIVGTLGFNFNVLLPLLAKDTLHAGPQEFGLLTSALGVGALTGALLLARRGGRPTHLILAGTAGLFGLMEALAGQSTSLIVTLVFIALTGVMMSTFSASANTTVQLSSPPEMRGRVMSVYTTIFIGSTPIGNLATSSIAAAWGVPLSFAFTGLPCVLAAGLATWLWRREKVTRRGARATVVDGAEVAFSATAQTRFSTGVIPESVGGASGIHHAPHPSDADQVDD
ncbi:MAG TPA: MFS transporter [Ktedonobacterales bacterium]|jgi:MFS family permease|nr:MFS transporter [Ktedonobacterales bacterium]